MSLYILWARQGDVPFLERDSERWAVPFHCTLSDSKIVIDDIHSAGHFDETFQDEKRLYVFTPINAKGTNNVLGDCSARRFVQDANGTSGIHFEEVTVPEDGFRPASHATLVYSGQPNFRIFDHNMFLDSIGRRTTLKLLGWIQVLASVISSWIAYGTDRHIGSSAMKNQDITGALYLTTRQCLLSSKKKAGVFLVEFEYGGRKERTPWSASTAKPIWSNDLIFPCSNAPSGEILTIRVFYDKKGKEKLRCEAEDVVANLDVSSACTPI
ncbi:hypothetical protein SISNIDRAFT_465247 [Sistotremastrum niveocremeum HHB9708]|uniref:C2 domain-containing protein n=1 Tax=Sistotremastrum niveocremeum HHB9708 TaxID=1314777 RepID=A0A164VMV0_9AGAM|nr:hypothetical protein SISNIDRAFT_465247 [Sistotremastrum niveocremeum HHB9708]